MAAIWELEREFAVFEKLEHLFTGAPERMAECLFGNGWPRLECFVAEVGGELAGLAIFYGAYSTFWTRPLMWLEDLFVSPRHRGLRIGRALFAAVAAVAVERGCARMDWAVLDWNRDAIDFYEHLGAASHGGWFTYRLSGEGLAAIAAESRAKP
jgi:hypothetical protein